MGDLTADKNQESVEKKSIFDSFKFWGPGPRHRNSQGVDIDKSPTKITNDDSTDHTPKEKLDKSSTENVKLYETISGNYIITRGWDGNNMWVFKIRRKML
jgi:hypothetical protein